ncbi:MAG: toll/interleukin-1 receptor domain-containing protein [Chloroflexi bacterium]|nr:toll/interleukin-1 receptor domain-containing protein [Chloroflexota bacterium]
MANQEQLEILMQGSDVWNRYRADNKAIEINLGKADLSGFDLSRADLSGFDLSRANLSGVDLSRADLSRVSLSRADLTTADLSEANLSQTNLTDANLTGTSLNEAYLGNTTLFRANFRGNLLSRANFSKANIGFTIFSANPGLYKVIGLETIKHGGPSFIDTYTLQSASGQLPEAFLRGCGLPDWEIEAEKLHNPALTNEQILNIQYRIYDLRATRAIQVSPLFISYSHADTSFVDHLDKTLVDKGIRFWRDIHDMTSGRMETQIDRAIRQNPTVLLILSKNSLNSDWVQHEVRAARSLEKELGRDALCPVALDDSWKSAPWPARIMEQIMEYNILDFSGWDSAPIFEAKFSKLLSGLDLFYKKPEK